PKTFSTKGFFKQNTPSHQLIHTIQLEEMRIADNAWITSLRNVNEAEYYKKMYSFSQMFTCDTRSAPVSIVPKLAEISSDPLPPLG
ncbi:MAG: hypothetical protein SOY02_01380, partial [Candidatus Onthovivens sp.]|nr:hypothetical protein [Candidatus Onthovivens sp.]